MTIRAQMLMCDKVTHKKLIDSNLLFRKIKYNNIVKKRQTAQGRNALEEKEERNRKGSAL